MAAISSIRLFVVPARSPPHSSLEWPPYRSTTPQPPGPGLPLHAPSVQISTTELAGPFDPFDPPGPAEVSLSATAGNLPAGTGAAREVRPARPADRRVAAEWRAWPAAAGRRGPGPRLPPGSRPPSAPRTRFHRRSRAGR